MDRAKTMPFSPVTTTAEVLGSNPDTDTEVELTDIGDVPDVGEDEYSYIVLCDSERFDYNDPSQFETCRYTGKDVSKVTGLVRGVEGTIQEWSAGAFCACFVTSDMIDKMWDYLIDIGSTLTEDGEEWVV